MKTVNIHAGWLKKELASDDHETLKLDGEPIAEELSYISNNIVTVRYYISNKEATEEELTEDFLINTLYGNIESDYGAVYSEYTGYLWTNDELNVGGHDLLAELMSNDGKYLYLIIELDVEKYEEKERASKERSYTWALQSAIRNSRSLDKSFNDLVTDLKNMW